MSNPLKMIDEDPWYKEGLSFECTGCGNCCTGSPGYVWVTEEEIEEIAGFLGLPVSEIRKRYLRQKHGRFALIELKYKNYDCIFLKDNKCSIYPVRPTQCRTYPWWVSNLSSREAWEKASQTCEGMRCGAPKVSKEEIEDGLSASNI